jgi:hypothetical protein
MKLTILPHKCEKKIKKEKHIEKDKEKSKALKTTSTKSKGKEQDDGIVMKIRMTMKI